MSGSLEKMYTSVDPAPAAPEEDVETLTVRLLDKDMRMFQRMRALFSLRAIGSPEAVDAIGRSLSEVPESALLRHEAAYIFGQMTDVRSIPFLTKAALEDESAMVRHEACESLGNMPEEAMGDIVPVLKKILVEDESLEVRQSCEVALDNLEYLRDPTQF